MACWSSPTIKDAYRLCVASIVATLLAVLAGFAFYVKHSNSLALVFGLENCADLLSSAVVLWRFFIPSVPTPELEEKLKRREKRASIAISFILAILGLSVLVTAADDFGRGKQVTIDISALVAVAAISLVLFGTFAAIKFHYSERLESASLYKDGICSLIGMVLGGALFINSLLIERNADLWWMDPLVALLCGVAALWVGLQALYEAHYCHKLPIFSMQWWAMSQGDGTDERSGRPLGPEDYLIGAESPNNAGIEPPVESADDNVELV